MSDIEILEQGDDVEDEFSVYPAGIQEFQRARETDPNTSKKTHHPRRSKAFTGKTVQQHEEEAKVERAEKRVQVRNLRKQRALEALATSRSINEAAEQAGISVATMHNYLKDGEFRQLVAESQKKTLLDLGRGLLDASFLAMHTLEQVLDDKNASTSQRIKAADSLLKHVASIHNQAINSVRIGLLVERAEKVLRGEDTPDEALQIIDIVQE